MLERTCCQKTVSEERREIEQKEVVEHKRCGGKSRWTRERKWTNK
jgi:hypothetical protein